MGSGSMEKLKFIIHRNFCAQYNTGDLLGAKGVEGHGASALVGMSPERMRVYLEEYAEELTAPLKVEEQQGGTKIAAESGDDARALMRFMAKLPLKGESADAVRSLEKALSEEDLGVTIAPESLELTNEGMSLMLEAPGDMDEGRLLENIRRAITPKGFAVDVFRQ